jgi:hypothetical protein
LQKADEHPAKVDAIDQKSTFSPRHQARQSLHNQFDDKTNPHQAISHEMTGEHGYGSCCFEEERIGFTRHLGACFPSYLRHWRFQG